MRRLFFVASALLLSTVVHAKPSADVAKEVIDYYFHGQSEGVLLADVKLCEAIHEEGELKNECNGELDAAGLEQGQPVLVWMMFMVPSGLDPQEILVQLNHQGMTMAVEKASVASSLRYRVWRKLNLDRPGDWNVKIAHDNGQSIEMVKELNLSVQPKAAE